MPDSENVNAPDGSPATTEAAAQEPEDVPPEVVKFEGTAAKAELVLSLIHISEPTRPY